MYTKKHYEATAEIIKRTLQDPAGLPPSFHHREIVMGFANYFAADNGRFNRQQFYNACGLEYNGQ